MTVLLAAYFSPVVTSVSPNTGGTGTSITITGKHFGTSATVTIDGYSCTNVTRLSLTSITCIAPSTTIGVKDIIVTNEYPTPLTSGTSGNGLFEYTISVTSLDLTLGDTLGGETRTITGFGFTGAVASDVLFGATAATSITVVSDTQIDATVPAHTAGVVNVSVLGVSLASAYEFWDPTVPATPSMFLESPDYAASGGDGTWTARVGYTVGNNIGTAPTESPTGTPLFVAANFDTFTVGVTPDNIWGLSATVGATIAVVLNITSLAAIQNVIATRDFYGSIYLDPNAGSPVAAFAYYDGSYVIPQLTVPSSGRAVLVAERDVTGSAIVKITNDGVSWTNGSRVVGNMTADGSPNTYIGYHQPLAIYPLDATIKALVTVKAGWSDANVAKFYRWALARHP
jgi:hypothetical protein